MIKQIVKRDGTEVSFDPGKVWTAVKAAMEKTEKGLDEDLLNRIVSQITSMHRSKMTVEEISDIVEKKLMESSRKDVAKEYIQYRHRRDVARQSKVRIMFEEIIDTKSNDVTRENANMNSDTPAGMMMKFASETTKPFVDNYLLPGNIKDAVDNNLLHIHDKDYYPTKSLTCLQHPLDVIFKKGFRAGHGELRAPSRLETAAIQACVSMETTQNEMHGGQSIPALDFYLAPYVKLAYQEEINRFKSLFPEKTEEYWEALRNVEIEDYLTVTELDSDLTKRLEQLAVNAVVRRAHQAMEAFVHNMNNIHSRGGNQVVFSSVNYGTDTSAEGRCIIRELLNTTWDGVGNGATAIFPIQIWKLKKGVSAEPGDRNYDLYLKACKVTARRFFPNFLNLDATYNVHPKWNENDPERYRYEVATMGCRTRVFADRHGEKTSVGRGNLSFTTINLPRLAIELAIKRGILVKEGNSYVSKLDAVTAEELKQIHQEFLKEVVRMTDVAAEQLKVRYDFQSSAKAKQFPLLMSGLWKGSEELRPEDSIQSVMKHGTLSIGFIGLAETLKVLIGKHHGESEEAQKLGLEIITEMKKAVDAAADKEDLNYTLLATPAEGLSGKFTKIDIKEYGVIEGVTDKDFYTNSNHVPVGYKCSAAHKLKVEGPYHELTNAGHIAYIELDGSAVSNVEAIDDIVQMMRANNIGYGSINFNCCRCEDCGEEGFERFEGDVCPRCGSDNTTYLARITGYLTSDVRKWNGGKKAEFKDRVKHSVN